MVRIRISLEHVNPQDNFAFREGFKDYIATKAKNPDVYNKLIQSCKYFYKRKELEYKQCYQFILDTNYDDEKSLNKWTKYEIDGMIVLGIEKIGKFIENVDEITIHTLVIKNVKLQKEHFEILLGNCSNLYCSNSIIMDGERVIPWISFLQRCGHISLLTIKCANMGQQVQDDGLGFVFPDSTLSDNDMIDVGTLKNLDINSFEKFIKQNRHSNHRYTFSADSNVDIEILKAKLGKMGIHDVELNKLG